MKGIIVYTLACSVLLKGTQSALSFASYYQDHMVLQMAPKHAVLWGFADTLGDTVRAMVNNVTVAQTHVQHSSSSSRMVWKLQLPPYTKGPYTITVTSRDGQATLHDVLFGDVWVCSGQSNMQFNLNDVINNTQELLEVTKYPNIRVFMVKLVQANTEKEDLPGIHIRWSKPTTASLREFSAVCWLYAKYLYPHVNHPIGLVESNWGGTNIESWSSPEALAKCNHYVGPAVGKRAIGHSVLWNAMIHPLLKMTIYGAIWYQGESNAYPTGAVMYACRFPTMISDWRKKFSAASGNTSPNFPFGFVQLAAWRPPPAPSAFPRLRWAQTADVGYVPNSKMPNTFMAVAMDLPDFGSPTGSIHPRYKQDVAKRLALAGRAIAYAEKGVVFEGPRPTAYAASAHGNQLTITFDHGTMPIDVRSNSGFEACCSTDAHSNCSSTTVHWTPAPITAHHIPNVVLDTSHCHGAGLHLAGVRYAWQETPCALKQCTLYGRDSQLPTAPFIKTGGF